VDAVEVVVAPGNEVDDLVVGDDDGAAGRVDFAVFGADDGVDVEPARDVVVVAGASVVDASGFSVVGVGFAPGVVRSGAGAGRTST
jgi:hypothetical protein